MSSNSSPPTSRPPPSPAAASSTTTPTTAATRLTSLSRHLLGSNNNGNSGSTTNPTPSSQTRDMATAPPPPPPPPSRPPITAHVLDTTSGKPAEGINVKLFLVGTSTTSSSSSSSSSNRDSNYTHLATGTTNADGRISSWDPASGVQGELAINVTRGTTYALRFDTGSYFKAVYGNRSQGGSGLGGFFPWVDVVFECGAGDDEEVEDGRDVKEREHYHVPLLLSRFGFSTYRGS